MDFEDFFKHRKHHGKRHDDDHDHHEHHDGPHHGHDHDSEKRRGKPAYYSPGKYQPDEIDGHTYREDGHNDHRHDDFPDIARYAHGFLANKKLILFVVLSLLFVIAVIAVLIFPLIGDALSYVDKYGLKGIIEKILLGSSGSR